MNFTINGITSEDTPYHVGDVLFRNGRSYHCFRVTRGLGHNMAFECHFEYCGESWPLDLVNELKEAKAQVAALDCELRQAEQAIATLRAYVKAFRTFTAKALDETERYA